MLARRLNEFTPDVSSLAFLSGANRQQAKDIAENRTFSYQQIHAKKASFVNIELKVKVKDLPSFGGTKLTKLTKLTNVADPPSYGGTMNYKPRTMNHEPFTSIENLTLAHFRQFSSLFTNLPSTSVENPLQIDPFYAKQTQFAGCSNEYKYLY